MVSIGNLLFVRSEEVDNNFKEGYKTLVAGGEIVCKKIAARFPSIPKPKAVVLDVSKQFIDSWIPSKPDFFL